MDYKFLGALERGEKTPSFESIERIAKALDVDYYEFFLPESLLGSENAGRLMSVISHIPTTQPELRAFFQSLIDSINKLERTFKH